VSARYDVAVIGGGINGLTTAARLARSGRSVVVLERRSCIGGLAAAEEFHPGYRSAGVLHDTRRVRPRVFRALELDRAGLAWRPAAPDVLLLGEGSTLRLAGDVERASSEIARLSSADAEGYARFRERLARFRPVLEAFLDEPALDPIDPLGDGPIGPLRSALRLRRLGRKAMEELLRIPPMPIADWLSEWFGSDLLRAGLALPALGSTWLGPRSPGGAFNFLLTEAPAGPGVTGGGAALAAALEHAARAAGAELRTESPVTELSLDGDRIRGVRVADGEPIAAGAVAASCDPRHLVLDLLPPGALPQRDTRRLQGWRGRGTTSHLLLALDRPPRPCFRFARLVGSLDGLEQAFDAVKYCRRPARPPIEVQVPTAEEPGLAPPGHAVLSALVHYTPYELRRGWSDEAREALLDDALAMLEERVPGLRASVVASVLRAPPDLESIYGCRQGHLHHGEHALDQLLLRPAPGFTRHRTRLGGLFLCGAGSHPGGGLTCAPGWLAAEAIRRWRP